MALPHTAQVLRRSSSVSALVETPGAWTTVHASLPCEIEPQGAKRKMTLLGSISGRVYQMSWGTEEVLDGDRVVWNNRTFRFHYDSDDTQRLGGIVDAYQTGILTEERVA